MDYKCDCDSFCFIMSITIRQLEYAVAVAEHRSFRRAAETCFVTQPALSAQIQELEAQLGLRLFERDRRRVLVTRAGEEIVRRARRILTEAADLAETARALATPFQGILRLGVIPTVAPYLLPKVLPRIRRRHTDLRLRLREDQTARLVEALAAGELDLLLLALEADLGGAETHALFEDPFLLAVPGDHPLAARKQVRQSDLSGREVMLLDDGHCLRDQALELCSRAGAEEPADFRAGSLGTLVQMVACGEAVTLLPRLAVAVEVKARSGIATVAFAAPVPHRTIGLAWRATSARREEFLELAGLMQP